jgi:hypothetical protein
MSDEIDRTTLERIAREWSDAEKDTDPVEPMAAIDAVMADYPRLLSAGSALAEAMRVALPWLELRSNEETVATARAALSAWEEATKPAPLDGKGEEGSKP